jgi:hypothetical protein
MNSDLFGATCSPFRRRVLNWASQNYLDIRHLTKSGLVCLLTRQSLHVTVIHL